jgi:hypothetical protein
MKHTTTLLAAPVCAVAAAALLAAPAHADTTFTVSPGGAWSGTRAADSSVGIRDAVRNQVVLCSGLAVSGSFKSGTALSGTNIGALTNIAFTGCKVEGVAVTATIHTSAANPAPINLTGEFPVGSTAFFGQATNISLTLVDANGCHVEVGAKSLNGGGPGFTGVQYRTSDHRFSFSAGGKGLFVQTVTPQCGSEAEGLEMSVFERISLGGFGDSIVDSSVFVSPPQTITSP